MSTLKMMWFSPFLLNVNQFGHCYSKILVDERKEQLILPLYCMIRTENNTCT